MVESTNVKAIGAALVVGGGIAGVQAALDLADSGVKVFLVEREPAIGGKMAQLDKTFPTNDCAMCILSPKLVEAGRHRNIEILTNSDFLRLDGEAGQFTATIRRRPRYISLEDCTACDDCVAGVSCCGPQRVQRGPIETHSHLQTLPAGRTQRICHLQERHQSLQVHLPR